MCVDEACDNVLSKEHNVLSEEQSSVIYSPPGRDMMVIACPGSGKTRTMVNRVRYLLREKIVTADQIMVTTFTLNATKELMRRIPEVKDILTIDAFSYRICKENGFIDSVSGVLCGPDMYKYYVYEHLDTLKDFGYKYVFVDEVQDIDEIQFRIIDTLKKDGAYLYMTGDDKQNIYGFRGSSNMYITEFIKMYEGMVVKYLTTNFRSSENVISFVNGFESGIPSMFTIKSRLCDTNKNSGEKGSVEIIHVMSNKRYPKKIFDVIRDNNIRGNVFVLSRTRELLNTTESYFLNKRMNGVNMTFETIHGSKGLECETVFLIGMTKDIIDNNVDGDFGDEMRLFYVGVTRSVSKLYILYHKDRCFFSNQRETNLVTSIKSKSDEINALSRDYHICEKSGDSCENSSEACIAIYLYYIKTRCRDRCVLLDFFRDFLSGTEFDENQYAKYGVDKSMNNYKNDDIYIKWMSERINRALDAWLDISVDPDDMKEDLYTLSCCLMYKNNKKRMLGFYMNPKITIPEYDVMFHQYTLSDTDKHDMISFCKKYMLTFIYGDDVAEYLPRIRESGEFAKITVVCIKSSRVLVFRKKTT